MNLECFDGVDWKSLDNNGESLFELVWLLLNDGVEFSWA